MRRFPEKSAIVNELIKLSGGKSKELISRIILTFSGEKLVDPWKINALSMVLETAGPDENTNHQLKGILDSTWKIAMDPDRDLEMRIASVKLIGLTGVEGEKERKTLFDLLKVTQPAGLQAVSCKALLGKGDEKAAGKMLQEWKNHSPALRQVMINEMVRRKSLTMLFLRIAKENDDLRSSIDLTRRQLLLTHNDDEISKLAKETLQENSRPARAEVLKRYGPTINKPGDKLKGRDLFVSHCSSCHRLDGAGTALGPDLAALSNRAPQTYLNGILDPNQGVDGNWIQFIAKTKNALTIMGSVTEETSASVTITGLSGERTKIAKNDLVSLVSTGRSLMPEGLESVISIQQMPDLLAYLQVAGEKRKVFENNHPALLGASEKGTVRLPAGSAEIYGPSIVFEQKYKNLGFWRSEGDRAEWTFEIKEAGAYEVWIDWALPDKGKQDRLNLTVSTYLLSAPVPGTGSWDKYQWGRMGKIKLKKGVHRLIVRIDDKLNSGFLMDLREVRLLPQGSEAPANGSKWKSSKIVDLSLGR